MSATTNSQPRMRMHSERLLSREEFLAEAGGAERKGVEATAAEWLLADARLAETFQAPGIQVELIEYPNSGVIARLGWERLQRGQTVRPEELEANYIRHSDAEIFSKPALVIISMPLAIRAAALNDVSAILALSSKRRAQPIGRPDHTTNCSIAGLFWSPKKQARFADSFARRRSAASGRSRTWSWPASSSVVALPIELLRELDSARAK